MCFAPYTSISTFVIEFSLAIYFLLRNPKDKLNIIIALLSFLLGIYQLNEFLICTTQIKLFTILAMSVTAILPAISINFALIMWRKKLRYYWNILIYAPAIFFIIYFPFLYKISAECKTIFIEYPWIGIMGNFYALYYGIYILAAAIIFYFGASATKSKYQKRLLHLGVLSMLIFTVPTFVFLIFLPQFSVQFASVLCEFGLLLAITFIIIIRYKEKHKLKFN